MALDDIDGLSYDYDEVSQALYIDIPLSGLVPKVVSAAHRQGFEKADKAYGGVLNYSLVADTGFGAAYQTYDGSLSASLDGWGFMPFGRLRSTGFVRRPFGDGGQEQTLRLESAFTADMPGKALKLTFGDFTSAGPGWARPIRMGGIELRRDFSLRSDLVTDQRLSYAGAAAVPSSVDVFIENSRVFSTQVSPGPFQLEDVPIQGGGDAEIVVRGIDGQVSRRTVSFFSSSRLLKKGMADYSLGFGRAREGFGIDSNSYGGEGIFTASLRFGLTEKLTLEGHYATTTDFRVLGGGVAAVPFSLGEVRIAGAASEFRGQRGRFGQIDMQTQIGAIDFNLSSMRTDGGFADLAYVTGLSYLSTGGTAGSLLEVPLAQDVVSVSVPVGRNKRRLGVSYVRAKRSTSRDRLASVSYGTSLGGGRGAISLNGSYNFETADTRLTLGLSMKIGKRTYAQASAYTDTNGRQTQDVSYTRTMGPGEGAYGYSIQAARRSGKTPVRVKGDLRTRYGMVSGEVQSQGDGAYLRSQLDGAVAFTGGGFAMGNQVNDGFAIVDIGVPEIPVYLDNRPVARTNARGRVLVNGLNAYRSNRVSVNVRDLPPDATLGVSAVDLVPSRGSGQHVSFGGSENGGVLVVLRGADGKVLPAGAVVQANGRSAEYYVGYDGETWIEDAHATNTLHVTWQGGACVARFGYTDEGAIQDVIDPVVCK
ncbi:fimbria/pilus outer membrane usher protein [Aquicoccus sp. G2-2]|uniref:fimbria/pilus outer membrane usher protein n=1 Tax=Aquicoccus sp. G2-2 TaxID=3092120 RepID=UPI002AE0063D|nr:fimbria/pilus outer membrane usher protein [Aquicoccus sp. G2-2]MEA1113607.1 fimbria/pilus outer membrane usher protein [Aquicoccus sp. G2-2]